MKKCTPILWQSKNEMPGVAYQTILLSGKIKTTHESAKSACKGPGLLGCIKSWTAMYPSHDTSKVHPT